MLLVPQSRLFLFQCYLELVLDSLFSFPLLFFFCTYAFYLMKVTIKLLFYGFRVKKKKKNSNRQPILHGVSTLDRHISNPKFKMKQEFWQAYNESSLQAVKFMIAWAWVNHYITLSHTPTKCQQVKPDNSFSSATFYSASRQLINHKQSRNLSLISTLRLS